MVTELDCAYVYDFHNIMWLLQPFHAKYLQTELGKGAVGPGVGSLLKNDTAMGEASVKPMNWRGYSFEHAFGCTLCMKPNVGRWSCHRLTNNGF